MQKFQQLAYPAKKLLQSFESITIINVTGNVYYSCTQARVYVTSRVVCHRLVHCTQNFNLPLIQVISNLNGRVQVKFSNPYHIENLQCDYFKFTKFNGQKWFPSNYGEFSSSEHTQVKLYRVKFSMLNYNTQINNKFISKGDTHIGSKS